MEVTDKEDLLYEVELRVANLTRRYKRLEETTNSLQQERDELLRERNELQARVDKLEHQLSVVALSLRDNQEGQEALNQLEEELKGILSTVDSCIARLDTKLSNGVKE